MLHDTTLYSAIYLVYFLRFPAGVQENRKSSLTDVGLCLYGRVYSLAICQRKGSVEMEILEHRFPTFMIGKPHEFEVPSEWSLALNQHRRRIARWAVLRGLRGDSTLAGT